MNAQHEKAHATLTEDERAYLAQALVQMVASPLAAPRAPTPPCQRPKSGAWVRRPGIETRVLVALDAAGCDVRDLRVYARGRGSRAVDVITALELAVAPRAAGPDDIIPQWHVSVSVDGGARRRPTDQELMLVRRAFEMTDAEEDNHHPGNARHLWLPVDPARRVGCQCKDDEVVVVEADGYEWTNPAEALERPDLCRACEISGLTGRPCPAHEPHAHRRLVGP